MAQRLMELDVEERCGAGYDEKTGTVDRAMTRCCPNRRRA